MKTILWMSVLLVSFSISAEAQDSGDIAAVQACMNSWGKTPFDKKAPIFSVLSAKVKVMGIGGETKDEAVTSTPALVLVKPNVSVMSKTTLSLLNPNGWYCLKGQVSVLGASHIKLHCSAHLASTTDGATVMGGGDKKEHGVTVLGSTNVDLIGDCPSKADPKAADSKADSD